MRVALTRIRQLGAHEVGHALGFSHNFAGSSQDRASVMDYPPQRLKLANGRIDLSDAYGAGLGRWDDFTVDWLYGDAHGGATALDAKTATALKSGLRYITDGDASRPPVGTDKPWAAAQPWASLWDDGSDPVGELNRIMQVRRVAIDRFGLGALRPDRSAADLRRIYVPIFLLHRYEVAAAAKLIGGGRIYIYRRRGFANAIAPMVLPDQQKGALAALISTLAPDQLDTSGGANPPSIQRSVRSVGRQP